MPQIIFTAIDKYHFQITIIDSLHTTHKLTIQPDYALKLAGHHNGRPIDRKIF